MLGLIAAVLIVLRLLGFFAFHITAGFIHIVLVVGVILLWLHLLRGRQGVGILSAVKATRQKDPPS